MMQDGEVSKGPISSRDPQEEGDFIHKDSNHTLREEIAGHFLGEVEEMDLEGVGVTHSTSPQTTNRVSGR